MLDSLVQKFIECKSVLIAGAGGGYDITGAMSLAPAFESAGIEVHYASLSFTPLDKIAAKKPVEDLPLYFVDSDNASESVYCPEAWLCRYIDNNYALKEMSVKKACVWCFEKCGVGTLRKSYEYIIEQTGVDGLVLLDGGIDLILKGNEASLGTPEEDLTSLTALRKLPFKVKAIACIGFGTELKEGISHSQVLERISEITADGGLWGVESLFNSPLIMKSYKACIEFIFSHQPDLRQSRIHAGILQSVSGKFGGETKYSFITPLMHLLWFFDLEVVAKSHVFIDFLENTSSAGDVTMHIHGLRKTSGRKEIKPLPW
ncbi:DUF1152 domain-containing protein [Myxococcota bacterium]|nr:DUF1152 domain-containing protein [Myxococcota bacterium]MBU1380423.1 DUF1152 domain-containing protein [Myxococcota bacterium]MBU1498355.1 DUF1152 domain-containing protein [Myxococcota bacterium]